MARKTSRTRYSNPRQRRGAQALARCTIDCSTRAHPVQHGADRVLLSSLSGILHVTLDQSQLAGQAAGMSLEIFLEALVYVVCFGWIPMVVLAVVRRRRQRSSYRQQLDARKRRRRKHRSGRWRSGDVTIYLDTLGPGQDRWPPP